MRRTGEEIERTIEDIKKDLVNGKSIVEILEKYNFDYYRLVIWAEKFRDLNFREKR